MPDASWIIVCKATGRAVMETFDFELCQFVNIAKYKVVPIRTYLSNLGR